MTLLSGNVRFIQIFARVPCDGASNESGVVENGNFQRLAGYFSETLEIRTTLLYSETQSVVSFSVIPKMNDLE